VQGEGADLTMVKALELLNRAGVDVIIIGRGGGSKEDLSAFNSEALVRAIAASKAPVISAVGHATDKSLTDRVADLYAETPTQAAMLAVLPMEQVRNELRGCEIRAGKAMKAIIDRMRGMFSYPDARLDLNSPSKYIEKQRNKLGTLELRMVNSMKSSMRGRRSAFETLEAKFRPANAERMVSECAMRLDTLFSRADAAVKNRLTGSRHGLESLSARLDSDNPHNVLRRGYSYVSDDSGRAISSARDLRKGSSITVKFRDGRAKAEIQEVKHNE
jgi:exodeoxyribonuclease VII large subunit